MRDKFFYYVSYQETDYFGFVSPINSTIIEFKPIKTSKEITELQEELRQKKSSTVMLLCIYKLED
jgi:hypothetical protein